MRDHAAPRWARQNQRLWLVAAVWLTVCALVAVPFLVFSDPGGWNVLDTFTRANESPLSYGGRWSGATILSTHGLPDLTSNRAVWNGVGGSSEYWGLSFAYGAYVFGTVGSIPGIDDVALTLMLNVRQVGAGTADFYLGGWIRRAGTDEVRIMRFDNEAGTLLSSANVEMSAGDSWMLLQEPNGTLELWTKISGTWTRQVQVSDTTYTDGGFIGFSLNDAGMSLSAFGGGEIPRYTPAVNRVPYSNFPQAPKPGQAGAFMGVPRSAWQWQSPAVGAVTRDFTTHDPNPPMVLESPAPPPPPPPPTGIYLRMLLGNGL